MKRMVLIAVLALVATPLRAERISVDPPLVAQVYLRGVRETVSGKLTEYDETLAVIQTAGEPRAIEWAAMTGSSAYALRARLIDKSKASDWLALGTFGWRMGVKDARYALNKAATMDPALKEQAEAVLATEPGELTRRSADSKDASPSDAGAQGASAPTKYRAATPEQAAAAIEKYRTNAKEIQKRLSVVLVELQTEHFLIFTDWNRGEFDFLKQNLEGAYALVSRQFDIPASENIFVGKLPVYMLTERNTFRQFAREIDRAPEQMARNAAGYYHGRDDGIGHMVMWKPDIDAAGGNLDQAKRQWAYVLTHEFTHAFVARYRGDRHIPTWLNEGIAEMIAAEAFPNPRALALARQMAQSGQDISDIFDTSTTARSGMQYPVMRTVVQMLATEDRRAFRAMFDAIKDGTPGEEALQQYYHCDYVGLANAWRQWASKLRLSVVTD